jgi:hypothetical protein
VRGKQQANRTALSNTTDAQFARIDASGEHLPERVLEVHLSVVEQAPHVLRIGASVVTGEHGQHAEAWNDNKVNVEFSFAL